MGQGRAIAMNHSWVVPSTLPLALAACAGLNSNSVSLAPGLTLDLAASDRIDRSCDHANPWPGQVSLTCISSASDQLAVVDFYASQLTAVGWVETAEQGMVVLRPPAIRTGVGCIGIVWGALPTPGISISANEHPDACGGIP